MWLKNGKDFASIAHEGGYRKDFILAITLFITLPAYEKIFLGRMWHGSFHLASVSCFSLRGRYRQRAMKITMTGTLMMTQLQRVISPTA